MVCKVRSVVEFEPQDRRNPGSQKEPWTGSTGPAENGPIFPVLALIGDGFSGGRGAVRGVTGPDSVSGVKWSVVDADETAVDSFLGRVNIWLEYPCSRRAVRSRLDLNSCNCMMRFILGPIHLLLLLTASYAS